MPHSKLAGGAGFQRLYPGALADEPQPVVAEQVLDALVEQWQRRLRTLFSFRRERLAMNCRPAGLAFTWCKHLPGDFVRYSNVSVRKSHWGNALTATLQTENARYAFPWRVRREQRKTPRCLWNATTEHCPGCASGLAG